MIWTIPAMAWVSRMCGGGPPKLPWGLDQWIYAAFFLPVLMPATGLWTVLGYGGAFLGKRTGHGRGFGLKEPLTGKPEKMEFPIRWLIPRISTYHYKILILWMTHILLMVGPAVAFAVTGHWPQAIMAALGTFNKPIAYAIGWEIRPNGKVNHGWKQVREPTQIGEFLTGAFDGVTILGIWLSL